MLVSGAYWLIFTHSWDLLTHMPAPITHSYPTPASGTLLLYPLRHYFVYLLQRQACFMPICCYRVSYVLLISI